jgi:flagellin-like hook-associated protein FlgL
MASGITINSNLAALNAQRRLGQSTQSVQQSFTRLSSGLRINKASDDAAGLAISESLNVDARVYTQGIRNLNDGISLTNIAEGAMQELTNITIRQRELATQSANGTLSLKQRQALNQEANVLVDEFNRITQSTDFNGTRLLDNTVGTLCVQGGYGSAGGVSFALAGELERTVGDGTFEARMSFTTGAMPKGVTCGKFNGDDILDMVIAQSGGVSVLIGNGDGTFLSRESFSGGGSTYHVTVGDLNGDGVLDIASADNTVSRASIFIGNGNGTFKASISLATGSTPRCVVLKDLNQDGILDVATSDRGSDCTSVFIGNGDGTFKTRVSFITGSMPWYIAADDLNADNVPDIVTADWTSGRVSILIGNGNGTFKARTSFAAGSDLLAVSLGDLNGDGIPDIGTATDGIGVLIGNGDGTFGAEMSFQTGATSWSAPLSDVNGDGVLDIATAEWGNGKTGVFLGNGDGTFKARVSFAAGNNPSCVAFGDMDGDGIVDMASSDYGSNAVSVFLSNTNDVTTAPRINLCTRQGALDAMATIDATLQRISSELGSIGSIQSRLGVAVNTLSVSRENYLSAKSQITDADVAQESAQLLKNQILQQAGAAVLAQANQAPALALMLLKGASPWR